VPIESLEMCSSFYEIKHAKKNEVILREGEVSDCTFFVEKGLLRMYSIDKAGKEHVIQFAPENWIISDTTSQLLNEKSRFYIEAIEDSIIVVTREGFFEKSKADVQSHQKPTKQSECVNQYNGRRTLSGFYKEISGPDAQSTTMDGSILLGNYARKSEQGEKRTSQEKI
jgi:CRP-like cAMP-binding protein